MMVVGRAMIEDEDAKGLEGFLTSPIFWWLAHEACFRCTNVILLSAADQPRGPGEDDVALIR